MMFKNKTFLAGVVAGVGVAAAALAGSGLQWPEAKAQTAPPISQSAQVVKTAGQSPVPAGAPLSFADIVERISPAVVSIETRSKVTAESLRKIPGFENFPFTVPDDGQDKDKGGDDDKTKPEGQAAPDGSGGADDDDTPEQFGAGSGFFISPDGYIVTNNHVIEGADEITVKLTDDRELKAKVVGRDEATDLAVIKVEGSNFPYVDFETTAKPRVGDWVIAIGNPFTLGGTVTAGIVSAYARDIGETYVDYIQIDAPINRGNSGGPTFDIYGRVIGVNTAIFSPNGQYAGIGFAIPADVADAVTRQLINGGKVARGYLGVTISGITDDMQESLGLPAKTGAFITEVTPGGPAARAGLQIGDIVTRINGQPIKDGTDLTRKVALARTGDVLTLELVRAGKPLKTEVRSGVRPAESELNKRLQAPTKGGDAKAPTPPAATGPAVLGLNVGVIDPASRQAYGIPQSTNGVLITAVVPKTPAARKGFRPGDVIVMAGDHTVNNPGQLQDSLAEARKAGRPSLFLLVQREGRNIPVTVPLEGGK